MGVKLRERPGKGWYVYIRLERETEGQGVW